MTSSEHINVDLTKTWIGFQIHPDKWNALITRFCSVSAFHRKLAQWQAIRKFEALDNESLQDIGIERYEIRDFVLKGGR